MAAHPCAICGAPNAPWGYRLPGLLRDLPDRKRGYLWACTEHKPEAEARWHAAWDTISHKTARPE